MEACGLKSIIGEDAFGQETVTPYGGVWIEIKLIPFSVRRIGVTPYGGVWIEISDTYGVEISNVSRLMEACGLKLNTIRDNASANYVTPYGGVWIEM